MKIIINILRPATLLSIFIIYCVIGCTKNEDFSDAIASEKPDFELIGLKHNEGLDFIYESIKNYQRSNSEMTLRNAKIYNIYDVVEDASIAFVMDLDNELEKDKLLEVTNRIFPKTMLRSVETPDVITINSDNHDFLTENQKYYQAKFEKILLSFKDEAKKGPKNIDIEKIIRQLTKLDLEIQSKCTNEESIPLLAATSIGIHSLQYWNDNLYKWSALIIADVNPNHFTPILKSGSEDTIDNEWQWFVDTLISMGQDDAIGGLIGAGALVGGVGAVPGAISGACYSSAGSGIKSLLQRWGIFS